MSATRFSTLRSRSAALAAALAITASACGGSDSTATTTATTGTMTESTTKSTEAPGSETTAAHSGDTMIEGSTLWTSADGTVSMEIDPTWTDVPEPVEGGTVLGAWAIGTDGANASVLDAPTGDAGLQEVVDSTANQLAQLGEDDTIMLIDSGVRKGPHGDIGYLEYTGTDSGFEGRIIQIFSVANGHVAVATFTTSVDTYPSISESVLPLLETIQAL